MQQCKSFQHKPDNLMCCTQTHAASHSSHHAVLGYTAAKFENPTTFSVLTESIQHLPLLVMHGKILIIQSKKLLKSHMLSH
jgi:hypothetical protein